MLRRTQLIGLTLGLVLPCLSITPAAKEDPPKLEALAQARYQSARELFDEAWLLYTRKGLSDNAIYTLSVRLMTAQIDAAGKPAARIAACQEHVDRMQKMQSMMAKVRGLGYSKKLELKEVDYFVHEARYWLAREQAK
jgi:hypothetical protein